MALGLSKRLKQSLLGNDSIVDGALKDLMSGFSLKIFAGARPDDPENSKGSGATLLATYTGCSFLDAEFDATLDNVVLKKEAASWDAIPVATGEASWFRCYMPGIENGELSDSFNAYLRIDGTISETEGDMVITDVTFTINVSKTIDQFNIAIT